MEEIKEIIIKTPNGQKKYGIADSEARQDVQQLTEGAPEVFDTFKEVAEYIEQDGATAAEIIKNVAANAQGIADEITRAKNAEAALSTEISESATRQSQALAEERTRAQAAERKNADAVVAEKERAEAAEAELGERIANAGGGDVTTEQLNEVKADVRANTTAIDNEVARATQAEIDAIEKGRQLALRALFVAAGAEYNDTDQDIKKTAPWGDTYTHKAKHYSLNGLGDITEEQMVNIYNAGRLKEGVSTFYYGQNNIRTFLPSLYATPMGHAQDDVLYRGFCGGCTNLEIALIAKYPGSYINGTNNNLALNVNSSQGCQYMFSSCIKLKKIVNKLNVRNATSFNISFYNCNALEDVFLYELKSSIEFSQSSNISKDSILFAITNANPTSAITIKLHHDAYTRLTTDQEVLDALSAKNEALTTEGKGGKISLVCATHNEEVTPNA